MSGPENGPIVIGLPGDRDNDDVANVMTAAPALLKALEMVRDADEDCKRDGLPTIPGPARKRIDAALAQARGEASA